jgi:hypothetical protein
MDNLEIIAEKSFAVGELMVAVQRQEEAGSDKPHQVQMTASIEGVDMIKRISYSAGAPGNADCDFAFFEQADAEKLVAGFRKFLTTKKGAALAGAA